MGERENRREGSCQGGWAGGRSGIWQTEVRQQHWKENDLGRMRLLRTKRPGSSASSTEMGTFG